MKYVALLLSIPAVLAAPRVVPFTGTKSVAGVSVNLVAPSNCTVSFQSLPYTIDCALNINVVKDGSTLPPMNVHLNGGAIVEMGSDNKLKASILYSAALPVPSIDMTNPASILSSLMSPKSGLVTIPLDGNPMTIPVPLGAVGQLSTKSVCIGDVIPNIPAVTPSQIATKALISQLPAATGSNVCVTLNMTATANGGAKINLYMEAFALDDSRITNAVIKQYFPTVRDTLKLQKFYFSMDLGQMLTQMSSSQTASDLTAPDGGFLLGDMNPINTATTTAAPGSNDASTLSGASDSGVIIGGVVAGCVIVAGVGAVAFVMKKKKFSLGSRV